MAGYSSPLPPIGIAAAAGVAGFRCPLPFLGLSHGDEGAGLAGFRSALPFLGIGHAEGEPAAAGFRGLLSFWLGGASSQPETPPPEPPVPAPVDPKLHGKRKQHKNLTFKAAQAEDGVAASAKPELATAPKPKERASGLLMGLLKRAAPAAPAPALAPTPAPKPAAAAAPAVAPTPAPAPAVAAEALADLEQRLQAFIDGAARALDAKLERLLERVDVGLGDLQHEIDLVLPMDSPRDPLNEALLSILPAIRDPLPNPLPEPEQPTSKWSPEELEAENERRARALAKRLL